MRTIATSTLWERLFHLCHAQMAPLLGRLGCLDRVSFDRLEMLWAVRVTQWFPVVLHIAWLRHMLVTLCTAQLLEQSERDFKQLKLSANRLPTYDVR
jgi:hypothetical protein